MNMYKMQWERIKKIMSLFTISGLFLCLCLKICSADNKILYRETIELCSYVYHSSCIKKLFESEFAEKIETNEKIAITGNINQVDSGWQYIRLNNRDHENWGSSFHSKLEIDPKKPQFIVDFVEHFSDNTALKRAGTSEYYVYDVFNLSDGWDYYKISEKNNSTVAFCKLKRIMYDKTVKVEVEVEQEFKQIWLKEKDDTARLYYLTKNTQKIIRGFFKSNSISIFWGIFDSGKTKKIVADTDIKLNIEDEKKYPVYNSLIDMATNLAKP